MRYNPSWYKSDGSVNNPRIAPRDGEVGIEVIEVDQWTASEMPEKILFDRITHADIYGEESDKARLLFRGSFTRMIVSPKASPLTGDVWYRKDNDSGFAVLYKTNYDSSD
mgnify:CR=1 FL=1